MTFRCWEDCDRDESDALEFEASSPEDAAKHYCRHLSEIDDFRHSIDVNVSAQSGVERIYWTVNVTVEMEPSFGARKAQLRDGPP